jgi:hypothetical protein
MNKPAVRKQYGLFNYAEGGTPDFFGQYEEELRSGAESFNTGEVYKTTPVQVGGVRAGDNGMMLTRNMWYGVLHAVASPSGTASGITPGQTYLSQWAGTPTNWAGDTPLDLQSSPVRAAPWRRQLQTGNPRGTFSSGSNFRSANV